MTSRNYSVLMSVYGKENPTYLSESLESIKHQTIPANDIVLVCDGPLTAELDAVITSYQEEFAKRLQVLRLETNQGLGNALNYGLTYCQNDLVARMDSDDICLPNRMELQLALFEQQPDLALTSGTVLEFYTSTDEIVGQRCVPESLPEILSFSRKRNPFNHPAMMFRKEAVLAAGGYTEDFHLFEDYELWIRMLKKGCQAQNLTSPLVYMRTTPDMYLRRGGRSYAKDMLRFHKWLRQIGWSSATDYLTGALPHAIICVLPNKLRSFVYSILHR